MIVLVVRLELNLQDNKLELFYLLLKTVKKLSEEYQILFSFLRKDQQIRS